MNKAKKEESKVKKFNAKTGGGQGSSVSNATNEILRNSDPGLPPDRRSKFSSGSALLQRAASAGPSTSTSTTGDPIIVHLGEPSTSSNISRKRSASPSSSRPTPVDELLDLPFGDQRQFAFELDLPEPSTSTGASRPPPPKKKPRLSSGSSTTKPSSPTRLWSKGEDAEEARKGAEVRRSVAEYERIMAFRTMRKAEEKRQELFNLQIEQARKKSLLLDKELAVKDKELAAKNEELKCLKVQSLAREEWARQKLSSESLAELEAFKNCL